MKIAITADEPALDANLDPRFGRCAYFIIVDTDTLEFEAVENPNIALGGGAGIQSAQLMVTKGARFVLTGNCGPKAHEALSAAGVGVIVGCSGAIRNIIDRFKAGQLTVTAESNVAAHAGIADAPSPSPGPQVAGGGPGTGQGPGPGGGGKGMGRGMGAGMGRGRGRGSGGGGGRGQGRGQGRGRGRG